MNIEFSRLMPMQTELRTVLLRDSTLYLDFSEDILFYTEEVPLNFDEMTAALKESIMYNYYYVKKIIVTIQGEQPYVMKPEKPI